MVVIHVLVSIHCSTKGHLLPLPECDMRPFSDLMSTIVDNAPEIAIGLAAAVAYGAVGWLAALAVS